MRPDREDWMDADDAFNAAMDEEREWILYTDPADEVLYEDYTLLPKGVLFSDIGDEWTY